MNFFTRYIEYLKDNPEGYWFKRKLYGWGWVPVSWQGWTTIAVFILLLVWFIVPFISAPAPSTMHVLWFLVRIVIWAYALLLVCYAKGEPPKWQWGMKEKTSGDQNAKQ